MKNLQLFRTKWMICFLIPPPLVECSVITFNGPVHLVFHGRVDVYPISYFVVLGHFLFLGHLLVPKDLYSRFMQTAPGFTCRSTTTTTTITTPWVGWVEMKVCASCQIRVWWFHPFVLLVSLIITTSMMQKTVKDASVLSPSSRYHAVLSLSLLVYLCLSSTGQTGGVFAYGSVWHHKVTVKGQRQSVLDRIQFWKAAMTFKHRHSGKRRSTLWCGQ